MNMYPCIVFDGYGGTVSQKKLLATKSADITWGNTNLVAPAVENKSVDIRWQKRMLTLDEP